MATDIKKHVSPAAGEVPSRAQLAGMILSANDVIPVANATEQAQVITALNSAGVGPTSSRPILFSRADAPGLHRIEYTFDGVVFVPTSGVPRFADLPAATAWAAANGALLTAADRCVAGGVEYRWTGTVWVPTTGAINPTAVTGSGVSIGAAGQIVLTNVAASTTLQIQGVFSGAFRNYRAVAQFTSKPSAAVTVQGIVGSTPAGGTSYSYSRQSFVGGSRGDAQGVSQANFAEGFIPILGTLGGGVADILAPNAAEATYMIAQHNHLGGFAGITNLAAGLNSTDQLTGLQIVTAAGGTTSGEIRIYGVS